MRSGRCTPVGGLLLMLGVTFPCFAQTPETVQEPPAVPAATKASAVGPMRDAVAVTRPKKGLQHPDLDKAWADYETSVKKASASIRAAITKQLKAATAKGDLAAVEKWQVISQKLEAAGEVPTPTEGKNALNTALADYTKAKEELSQAYDAVMKALTRQNKIGDAKIVRDEVAEIFGAQRGDNIKPVNKRRTAHPTQVFLSDLPEQDADVGHGTFGKNGECGYEGNKIKLRGVLSPKGISIHPPSKGSSRVTYVVPDTCAQFDVTVGINDTGGRQASPVVFKVFGDERLIWESKPLLGAGKSEVCSVPIEQGTTKLVLVVQCQGAQRSAHAVWCDPYFTIK